MNILGIKIISHDTGAALISDKGVIAIAEERLNRVKHSRGMFPKIAIDYCLNSLGVKPEEVDYIVIDQIGPREVFRVKKIFEKWEKSHLFSKAKIKVINHHDAHAATAFFCSPFKEAAVFVYDGSGEQVMTHFGVSANETETLYCGTDNNLNELHKTAHTRIGKNFPYTFGIGKLYSLLSASYINFGKYSEGKMMGLAAYGDDRLLKQFPPRYWYHEHNGHVLCNAKIKFSKPSREEKSLLQKIMNPKILVTLFNIIKLKATRIVLSLIRRVMRSLYHGRDTLYLEYSDPRIFETMQLPMPVRAKDVKLPDEYYSSVAYAAQKILEEVAVKWGEKLRKLTDSDNICIAGGLGLNIDANKHFINKVGFKNIFIQPAASDTGIPLGCALYGWHVIAKKPRFWEMKSASLGRPYAEQEILDAIQKRGDEIEFRKSSDICKETAKLLAEQKIVGWFNGGAEYGPRALGNRSIICDARGKDMKDTLNNRVKHREPWRPFATSMLAEKVQEWFHLSIPSPFMLLEGKVVEEKKHLIPAVLHVDDTSRIQAVTSESNARYYKLISEFNALTGVPLILNTSFNLAGDPIVETPGDALNTFLKTEMDYLVLEDYIISKKQVR